jgi:hypothetical protein
VTTHPQLCSVEREPYELLIIGCRCNPSVFLACVVHLRERGLSVFSSGQVSINMPRICDDRNILLLVVLVPALGVAFEAVFLAAPKKDVELKGLQLSCQNISAPIIQT